MRLDEAHAASPCGPGHCATESESGASAGEYRLLPGWPLPPELPPELHAHCAARTHRSLAGCRRGQEARTEGMGDGSLGRRKAGRIAREGRLGECTDGWVAGK
jgi:hypothetical protein